jgi:hypothetical protein
MNATQKLNNFFRSRTFTYIVFGFFIFEALWFVFSALYPMAFDEDFHFGLIKLYSHHWLPFIDGQPTGADQFGAVARDPSYLYHYLMSFPYRLVNLFTHNETTQIIWLRLMNVAMFTGSLWLYRKVMLRTKASVGLINVSFAIFVLIPIVPQLAAHINYDNFFMLLVPLLCLNAFSLIEGFQKRDIHVLALLSFVMLAMASTLVKYAGLPIILAAVVFLFVELWLHYRGHFDELWPSLKKGFTTASRPALLVLLGTTLIMSVLFVQRYGVNLVQYKNPVPDCGDILTVEQCNQYGPWARDHNYTMQRPGDFQANPLSYLGIWLAGMWKRLFFSINGNVPIGRYANTQGSPLPSWSAAALAAVGLVAVIAWWRKLYRGNVLLAFSMTVSLFYILVLWLNGFGDYDRVGHAVAINGRYLLPVLLLLAVALGRAIGLTLGKFGISRAKPILAAVIILLWLNGGGIFGFMVRSDSRWYWPNATVQKVNKTAHDLVDPLVIK